MSDPTFTTHGNEPVEARIVSWVLGEASAFEAAELERLCDAQPELMIFKRRMEAVHGLLGEAEKPSDDALWKLTSRKRLAIEKLLCDDDRNEINRAREQARDQRIHRSSRRAGWAIAACVLFAIVALALLDPFDLIIKQKMMMKESPMIVSYMAVDALKEDRGTNSVADKESVPVLELKKSKRKPLSTPIPPELIEGTPKPINVPNLESPKDGPAGGMIEASEARSLAVERRFNNASAPPQASAKVITSSETSSASIPVPDVTLHTPSLEFGDSMVGGKSILSGQARLGGAVIKHEVETHSDPFAAAPSEEVAEFTEAPAEPGSRREKLNKVGDDFFLAKGAELKRGLDAQDYDDAKRDYESDKARLTNMKQRRDQLQESLYDQLDADTLRQKVREQEERVEESRKVLATTVRTKGLIGRENKDGSQADLDAKGYGKVKEDFQNEQILLGEMKQQLMKKLEAAPEPKPVVPVDAGEETSAAQEPYSTFSLNISDASFRIAQAALAKGEQPDPAGIKVEQFYNAVNYGDPAPAAGQPVAGTVEQVAHPVVPGRTLVRVAIKTAAAGRSAQQSLRLTLLADQSGSMVREDRREAMNQALKGLGDLLTPNDVVNVIGFSRTPHLLAEGLQGQKAKQLQGLINMDANEGGTNLEEAMKLGEQLAKRYQQQGAQNRMVLFTDGAANLGDADPQSLAKKVEQLRQAGISFDIAGIAADGINDELLAELARKGNGRYYIVGKGESDQLAKQLAGAFNPAAENVKVQVRFNPARVGGYKLIGFEKDRLKKEDFRNDKVDAAEMAAEEAGVAIYQVEPLPEGEGELGEVSVRFRDTASGAMVERTWTIPYDSSAPSMEQATASMQLAVMSMLAGEKLKGGPLADAIDFKQLGKAQANVRQAFGADQRVGEMLQMIDQLK